MREEMLRGTARGIEGRIGLGVAKNKLHAAVPAQGRRETGTEAKDLSASPSECRREA